MYDAQLGRWHVTDAKSELYFNWSPYTYALNTPVNAIDPDGNLVVFINGNHFGDGGKADYWRMYARKNGNPFNEKRQVGAFDKVVMNHLNDHKAIYRDGSLGGYAPLNNSNSSGLRALSGYGQGWQDAKLIIESLARSGGVITESIKIITHSMGGAYSKGYAKAILDYAKKHNIEGVKIAFEADFAPYQPNMQDAVVDENMGPTLQFSHSDDALAGNKPIRGAKQEDTSDDPEQGHSISHFFNQISKLPTGNYKVENGKIIPVK